MASSSRAKNNQNIQVYVRCRPTNERERLIRSHEMVEVPSPREVVVKSSLDNKMTKKFTFDRTFGPSSEQHEVYKSVVAPLIEEVLSGYNCTVFAYGQTGTGKTHTMVGDATPQAGSSWDDKSEIGIIPRALSHLFEELRMAEVEFSMRASYLELYNEELSDLLASGETQIRIFDDANKKGSIIVQGLEEISVHNTSDVYKLLAKGQERRKMASTLMNAQSSRSHTIFSILVHIKENGMDGEELLKIGKLNLVDLAGSENISKAGNEKGIRARESVNINQSLLTLGRVITALVERTPHVPYRESKLTRLLQESLGGRTKTSIIATISPGHKDSEETINTLEYAHRAKNIQNRPEVNQKLTKKTVLKEYTEEIDKLKRDLEATREKNGVYLAQETFNEMQYQIETNNREISEKTAHIRALKDEMLNKEKLFTEVSLSLTERTKELKTIEKTLDNTKKVLNSTQRCYQEKKQLAMCHKRTEQLLTGQAMELMDVAETASNETYRLHETIDRRRNTDAKIEQVCGQFSTSMNGNLSSMAAALENFTMEYKQQTSEVLQQLKKSSSAGSSACTKSTANLEMIIDCEQGSKREIDVNLSKHKNELEKISQKHANAKRIRLATAEKMQNEATSDIASQKIDLTDSLTAQSNFHSTLEKLFTKQTEFLTVFSANLTDALSRNAEIIEKLQSNQATITRETKESDDLSEQLLSFVQDIVIKSQKKNATLRGLVGDLNSAETMVRTCESDIRSAAAELESGQNGATAAIKTSLISGKEMHSTIETQVMHILDSRAADTRIFASKIIETENVYESQDNELSEQVNAMIDDISVVSETAEINLTAGLQAIIHDVQSEQERILRNHSEMVDLHRNLEEIQNGAVKTLNDCVEAGQQRLQSFRANELKVYAPTGQTPNKRDYSYPKVLAATSPSSSIIRRFWNEHDGGPLDCSMVICEDGEAESLNESGINENKSSLIQPLPFSANNGNRLHPNAPTNAAFKASNSLTVAGTSNSFSFDKENTF